MIRKWYRRGTGYQKGTLKVYTFNWEERDKLRKKWDAMDVEDVKKAMTSLQEELRAEATELQDHGEPGAV